MGANENYTISHNARLSATAGAFARGVCIMKNTAGEYVIANAANRALYGRKAAGIALRDVDSLRNRNVDFQFVGVVTTDLSGLGAGTQDESVCVSTTGTLVRASDPSAVAADIVGRADADGTAYVLFGKPQPAGAGITPPAGATAGDLLVYSGGAWNRLPIGTNGQALTVVGGAPAWQSAAFDPASLSLTGYWRDYAGAPWLGSASAGPSNARSLPTGTAPVIGASFGAHPSAQFNGTTMSLASAALAYDSYLSTSGYYIGCVFSLAAVSAPGGAAWQDQLLVGDTQGNFYLGVSTSGIRAGHYDGSYKATPFIACATATKHYAEWWYDGTTVSVRLNGGAAQTVAAGNGAMALSACSPKLGNGFAGSGFLNGSIARVIMANGPLTSTIRDQLRADAVTNYGTI